MTQAIGPQVFASKYSKSTKSTQYAIIIRIQNHIQYIYWIIIGDAFMGNGGANLDLIYCWVGQPKIICFIS